MNKKKMSERECNQEKERGEERSGHVPIVDFIYIFGRSLFSSAFQLSFFSHFFYLSFYTMERTGSGFYIIDAFSLRQTSKKPFHLEKRFLRSNTSLENANTTNLEEAVVKREALLEARRQKLNRKFLAVQKAVKEVEARKESQRLMFWQSLQVAELKRNNRIEERRAQSKELVERAKIVARQNLLRYEAEQGKVSMT